MRQLAMCGVVLFLFACGSSDNNNNPALPETFTATMTPAGELPPNGPVTDAPGASGTATFVNDGTKTTYTVTATGLTGSVAASHIHLITTPGTAGGVIVPFAGAAGQPANGANITGTFTGSDITPPAGTTLTYDQLMAQIRAGNVYANVHTAKHPNGEIAGILRPK
jgi:Cu/Zn superoxide dismutase